MKNESNSSNVQSKIHSSFLILHSSFTTFGFGFLGIQALGTCHLAILHLLPLFLGKFLHIHHFVFLIDNLKTEHGFNHVFHRDDATHGAVFVDNHGDVLFLLEQLFPDVGHALIFIEREDRTRQVLQFDIELVLRQFFAPVFPRFPASAHSQ